MYFRMILWIPALAYIGCLMTISNRVSSPSMTSISRRSIGPSSRGYVYPQGMPPRKPSKETRMKRQSSTKWAPTWRTTHAPEKVGSRDAFCAEFEHVSEGQQVRVYIHTRDLNKFWNARQKRDQAQVEQVLRAILECYVNEKGVPPRYIEAQDVASLRDLQLVFTNHTRAGRVVDCE